MESTDSKWVQKLIKEDTYTFADCVKFPKVMQHRIKEVMKAGDDKGYPIVNPEKGDVPDALPHYDADTAISDYMVHLSKPHPEVPCMRHVSLNAALEFIRNEGHAPVKVRC